MEPIDDHRKYFLLLLKLKEIITIRFFLLPDKILYEATRLMAKQMTKGFREAIDRLNNSYRI
jgi:hypothetical protein